MTEETTAPTGYGYGAPGRDSQTVPSLSPSRPCGSLLGPPAAIKKLWAADHVSKSPQLRSSTNGSNSGCGVAVGVGVLVAVGLNVLVAIGFGADVADTGIVGVGVEDGAGVVYGVGGSVVVGASVPVGDGVVVGWAVAGGGVAVVTTVVGRLRGTGVGAVAVAVGRGIEFGRGTFGVGVGATCVAVGDTPEGSSIGLVSRSRSGGDHDGFVDDDWSDSGLGGCFR